MNRVLIIAAHPDDDILGCGGIMSKYKNKIEFRVIFIAEGSSCRFKKENINKIETKKIIENRNNCINVGSRQSNRSNSNHILNVDFDKITILKLIKEINKIPLKSKFNNEFGNGNSDILFLDALQSEKFWETKIQKQFQDV